MKILLSSRGLFVIAIFVVVATNIVVLSGVFINRSSEPDAQITLTEREMKLPYSFQKENSGLVLRIIWRSLAKNDDLFTSSRWGEPAWLNTKKLEELGFNIKKYLNSVDGVRSYKRLIPKEVFIVLENDGASYKEVLKRVEESVEEKEKLYKLNPYDKTLRENFEGAEKRLQQERITKSRLFVIDAGLDASELREKYEDKGRYIITKGLIKARYHFDKKEKAVVGYISRLTVENIHVPLKYRQIFDTVLAKGKKSMINGFSPPRFEVELVYGSRLEPWINSVNMLSKE